MRDPAGGGQAPPLAQRLDARDAGSAVRRVVFAAAQLTWGAVQSAAGLVVALAHRDAPRCVFHGAVVTEWERREGLSLGLFVFVPRLCPRRLLVHEYGHCVQSLVFGPAYVPLFVLPSLVWAGMPALVRMRERRAYSYYRFYTERLADVLAERVLGEPGMGFDRA